MSETQYLTIDNSILNIPDATFAEVLNDASADEAFKYDATNDKILVKHSWAMNYFKSMECDEDFKLVNVKVNKTLFMPSSRINIQSLFESIFIGREYNLHIGIEESINPINANRLKKDDATLNIIIPSALEASNSSQQFMIKNSTFFVLKETDALNTIGVSYNPEDMFKELIAYAEESGEVRHDDKSIAYFIYPNTLVLNHYFNTGVTRCNDIFRDMYKDIFNWTNLCMAQPKESFEEARETKEREQAVKCITKYLESEIASKGSEISDTERTIEQNRINLSSNIRKLEDLKFFIKDYSEDMDTLITRTIDSVMTLKSNAKIRDVKLNSTGFCVYTDPLLMTVPANHSDQVEGDQRTATRVGGPYIINFTFNQSRIIILAANPDTDNRQGAWGGQCHPHVSNHGEACWGNASETIAEMHGKREFAMLTEFVMAYLETCNPADSAGAHFHKWPIF